MNEAQSLAEQFEEQRTHLRAVAYRMLGSLSESDDAVQEAWLRLSRSDAGEIQNLRAWLTTVVARISLDMLRARKAKREEPLEVWMPDPIVTSYDDADPEQHALVADSVGIALLVVLETLSPAERLAYVLHDMFGVPFEEIASITGRSPEAARKLASRARRRVQADAPVADPDLTHQREVIDAFAAASENGDFEALLSMLDPNIVLREDAGVGGPRESVVVRGARAVAERAWSFRHLSGAGRTVLVNGAIGGLVAPGGRPFALLAFTVADGRIVEINILGDPLRLSAIELSP